MGGHWAKKVTNANNIEKGVDSDKFLPSTGV